jgi:hypothetical protein
MPLSVALAAAFVTAASDATGGTKPPENVGAVAEVVRLAGSGDPIAYGRLMAFGTRCGIEPELAGSAATKVATSALRTGRVQKIEEFFTKAQPGLRQGNSVPKAAIDCAATRQGLLELAGASRGSSPGLSANDPHAAVISRNSCVFKTEDPAAIMMTAYLNEKNGIDGLPLSSEVNVRRARLADIFIAPHYMDRYRIVPGTVELDTKGSRPEKLLCVKVRGGVQLATTGITNRESGWSWVMEYQLAEEKGRVFIMPTRPPAAFNVSFKYGNDPTTSIGPMSVVDGYPDTKE